MLEGCHLADNFAGLGGAVYWWANSLDSSDLEIRDSSFDDNVATYKGGAVCIYLGGNSYRVSITDSSFTGNSVLAEVEGEGGAVYLYSETEGTALEIVDSTFESNASLDEGGAISTSGSSSMAVDISGSTFSRNSVGEIGGAVEIGSGTLDLVVDDSEFFENAQSFTDGGGGALHINSGAGTSIEITDSTFDTNSAEDDGGAAYVLLAGGTISLVDTVINDNLADHAGGLYIYSTGELTLTLERTDITANQAISWQGGVDLTILQESSIEIVEGSIASNQAQEGGGLWLTDWAGSFILTSDRVDWGTGATDNVPNDLTGCGIPTEELSASESFTCTADGVVW